MDNQFYTIENVAEILGLHHKTVRKFITDGKLEASKIGKQWRISKQALDNFMDTSDEKINDQITMEEPFIQIINKSEKNEATCNKISVSSVVDIDNIDKDEYLRISNMLMALMNCKDKKTDNSTVNIKYDYNACRLKILLWGDLSFTEDMLNSIRIITGNNDLRGE